MTGRGGKSGSRTPAGSRGAAVVGSGPNGLAAAVTLARAGVPVTVFEAEATIGGGTRTEETTLPGVLHDVCSAIHPMALASPFFRAFGLSERIELVVPEASYGHPLDPADGRGGIAYRDLDRTAAELGADGPAFRRLFRPVLRRIDGVVDAAQGGSMLRVPRDPLAFAALGLRVLERGTVASELRFREPAAHAMIEGVAAHSIARMPSLGSAGVGVVLAALAHAGGWPVPVGGSRVISAALVDDLLAHGGRIETDTRIASLDGLRDRGGFDAVIFDTSARALARIAGEALPAGYRRRLERFRYGPGSCKVDFVLDGPVPWRDERMHAAPTVHLGGTAAEVRDAENRVLRGEHAERPFVLLAQTDGFDPRRNPAGSHAIWSYAHVPAGSSRDVREAVIAQIERFAPGFRDRIRAVSVTTADRLGEHNANYVGGDIASGAVSLAQLLARPVLSPQPWRTPAPGLFLASSSTPPGPGVHGMSGYLSARLALAEVFGLPVPELAPGAPSAS